jgi:heat shock protein HslJ
MNYYVKPAALLALTVLMQTACTSAPKFDEIRDKDWKLAEVRAGGSVIFERGMLAEDFKGAFTLRFDAERVSGAGAPNRYFAPYTLAEKQAIAIKPVAGTLMAALAEPEQLKEREFFAYLENANKWNLVKGNLELRSTSEDGAEAVLVFSLAD